MKTFFRTVLLGSLLAMSSSSYALSESEAEDMADLTAVFVFLKNDCGYQNLPNTQIRRALVFFALDLARHLEGQPAPVRGLVHAALWFGQRAVWFAAGALFARLAASRTSLLIAQLEWLRATLAATGVWQAVQGWVRG